MQVPNPTNTGKSSPNNNSLDNRARPSWCKMPGLMNGRRDAVLIKHTHTSLRAAPGECSLYLDTSVPGYVSEVYNPGLCSWILSPDLLAVSISVCNTATRRHVGSQVNTELVSTKSGRCWGHACRI